MKTEEDNKQKKMIHYYAAFTSRRWFNKMMNATLFLKQEKRVFCQFCEEYKF